MAGREVCQNDIFLYKQHNFSHNKSMKSLKICAICLCLMSTFLFCGCGDKQLPPAKITRDDARTGGSLSFVYDKNLKTIHIGGDGEVVQFFSGDEGRGLSEGTRVGLKVIAPDESLDVSNATLEMNGVNYSSADFLESINGQKQRFFNIYPLVGETDKEIKFCVTWADGTKKQEYKIIIVDGTKFMNMDGEVENN